jgi:copper chaperone CopZ
MKMTKVSIEGMTCLNCADHVQKALAAVPKVKEVTVTLDEGAALEHEGADEGAMRRAGRAAGDYAGTMAR